MTVSPVGSTLTSPGNPVENTEKAPPTLLQKIADWLVPNCVNRKFSYASLCFTHYRNEGSGRFMAVARTATELFLSIFRGEKIQKPEGPMATSTPLSTPSKTPPPRPELLPSLETPNSTAEEPVIHDVNLESHNSTLPNPHPNHEERVNEILNNLSKDHENYTLIKKVVEDWVQKYPAKNSEPEARIGRKTIDALASDAANQICSNDPKNSPMRFRVPSAAVKTIKSLIYPKTK